MSERSTPNPPLRWRSLSFLLLGSGALLLVAGVTLRTPVPLFLALPLLLAPPAAALAGPRESPRARTYRRTEGAASEVLLVGSVVPEDRVDARDLLIDLERPSSLQEVSGPRFDRTASEAKFTASWRAREPTICVVAAPRVVWRDPIGLVERPVALTAPDLVVERYPPELLHLGAVRLRRTMVFPGETRSSRTGVAGEFYGIRDAAPDDPPRRINWRATARSGRLLSNDYQVERTGDVLLILDTRVSTLGAEVDDRLLSISRAAAEGIAMSFLHEKARVGVGVFGEFLDAVPLAAGRSQRLRVRAALLGARLSTVSAPSERCAVAVSRYFPPGVSTILFSSLADDASSDLLSHLRRRGYPVIVLSPSPLPVLAEGATLAAEDEVLVARIAKLLRRNRVARAWREAPAIDWDDYWSLGGFVEFLRRPGTRRVG